MSIYSAAVAAERIRQSAIDQHPCPRCGGDRLRPDFTGSGKCHAPQKVER